MLCSVVDYSRRFTIDKEFAQKENTAKFSHKVFVGHLDGADLWFCKEASDPATARAEVLAQEFFRLLVPYQPKTYLAHNPNTDVYYVLSRKIPGYRKLPLNPRQAYHYGVYRGLGFVTLLAYFFNEVDLKNGNIGLDKQNRVVKIDGDWCFAYIRDPTKFASSARAISNDVISALPCPGNYAAFNWLDIRKENQSNQLNSVLLPNHLENNGFFRNEVNHCILLVLLLPPSVIANMVDAFFSAGGERYYQFILRRQQQLLDAVLKNAHFRNYIKLSNHQTLIKGFLQQLESFQLQGDQALIEPSFYNELEKKVYSRYRRLQAEVNLQQQNQILQNGQLLGVGLGSSVAVVMIAVNIFEAVSFGFAVAAVLFVAVTAALVGAAIGHSLAQWRINQMESDAQYRNNPDLCFC